MIRLLSSSASGGAIRTYEFQLQLQEYGTDSKDEYDNFEAEEEDIQEPLAEKLNHALKHRVKEDLELDGQAHYKVKRWPVIVEESSDESEVFDCEAVVSTYSNLDNHPGKIGAPEGRRKKKSSIEKVNDATSLRKDEQKRKQHVQEYSKEEKKERKGAVKEERREARRVKKEVKRNYTGVQDAEDDRFAPNDEFEDEDINDEIDPAMKEKIDR
ncbi:hypothetical protein RHSIM_Rhsim06G0016800 [Rhododendron simsii]|uniref:Uncharacterized protein n=1 Tax=Rhododendron simsii TaxID=118357 RepID=A0A834LIW0_RHOSS|nr:hypothetical protein RHSIM_Rhsim06G0016800 [Rhododendron simsii]